MQISLKEIIKLAKETYCGKIGCDSCICQIQKKEHGLEKE